MRRRGAGRDEVANAFPAEPAPERGLLRRRPTALERPSARLAQGLDVAIVRVVGARPGVDTVLATMHACSPDGNT